MSLKGEATASLLYNAAYPSERPTSPYIPAYPDGGMYPEGGYHQREGLVPSASQRQNQSRLPTRMYMPSTKWPWAFMGIVLAQAVIGLALEGYIFAKFQSVIGEDHIQPSDPNYTEREAAKRTVPTYLSLFIFGFIYQIVLTYDALRLKNTIQIIGLCVYNLGLLLEAAVQIVQMRRSLEIIYQEAYSPLTATIYPCSVVVPCVIGVGFLCLTFVAWKLYGEFSWSIYKNISADLRLKRRFLSYQIYISLLKFDFFFFLAFTVQFVVIIRENTTGAEQYLTIAAIPVTIILLILAAFWTRKENYYGMFLILFLWFGGLAYFLFKLIRMYAGPPGRQQDYLPARNELTVFAVMSLILLLVTITYCIICTLNFRKGLKPHLENDRGRRRGASLDMDKLYSHDTPMAGPGPSRMTID